ncbi:PEP-CTERM sorting domain-containing protein [Roseiarcus sp.]|uniref:PEP-CTERM sorting domain-containing protein n=1 Tax=Roseiarcus sp. TaxID=1969460 RepID=UPI003BAED511
MRLDVATVAGAVSSGSGILSQAIPEPSSWALMVVGFAGLSFAAYRGKNGPLMARNAA